MKIAVVTDSTAYLTDEEARENNIRVVPIPLIIDGQSYREGVDITTEDFYQKLQTTSSFPSTSQPPIGQLMELYQSLADEGYDTVISIHLTAAISGLLNTIGQLAEEMKETIKIIPFDSHLTVKMMGYLAIEAAQLIKAGNDLDTILEKLKAYQDTFNNVFVVDDLQNLVRGGRLSNASAFVGSILKIKPLLTMHTANYSIEAFEKVRSMKKAKLRCEQIFADDLAKLDYPVQAMVIHANAQEAGQKWLDHLQATYPQVRFELSYFGPVIGTHLGQGALGLTWMQDTSKKPL
ncbi:DegV family protein [Lactobacillus sp. 3B(2020)]|uniref:DegV family protein n=1 Tax=Lactobacillus sp. 3B(2020) TaxID=2695882 RepID=UPI0015DF13A5|nr:DegV family protein [Lactobacillus sp. 3B(2020)]QLL69929.1 DegV family EDD domain-containing protein [Lactobacillus sp. 3B(2020)]